MRKERYHQIVDEFQRHQQEELKEEQARREAQAPEKARRKKFKALYRGLVARDPIIYPEFDEFYLCFQGLEPRCYYCKRGQLWEYMTIDHEIPTSRGGSLWQIENLRLSCRDCNMIKGTLTGEEFQVLVGDNLKAFYERFNNTQGWWWRRRWDWKAV